MKCKQLGIMLILLICFAGNAFSAGVVESAGQIWMDRNLGASRVATSMTDEQAYGDLYQWGRGTDGHEYRSSSTTTVLSSSDYPGHGSFILAPDSPGDWRSTPNNNLWQGVSGINNPCPAGFRLPTEAEWVVEGTSWSSYDANGAFASPLKLTTGGYHSGSSGTLNYVGSYGRYWSATVEGSSSSYLYFRSDQVRIDSHYRSYGMSVRCIQEYSPGALPGILLLLLSDTYTLTVNSSGVSGASISSTPSTYAGITNYSRNDISSGTSINLTAPGTSGSGTFSSWSGCDSTSSNTCTVSMTSHKTVTANYETGQVPTVESEGQIWMDRNLGASRVATSMTDEQAYGDLYQWGRGTDGHEKRPSGTTTDLSSSDSPGHDDFIRSLNSPYDWRSEQNDNLWQGVSGVNNPCPVGFRLPTEAEWVTEMASWDSQDSVGAWASPLKLTTGGNRNPQEGSFSGGGHGRYWSSSRGERLGFDSDDASLMGAARAHGYSVRCIKH